MSDSRLRDGILAQALTCMHFALQGWQHEKSFTVISEMKAAGGFDDIVLVRERQGKSDFILIQQKHHKNSESDIIDKDLMNEFNLAKYFDSYLDIRNKFTSANKEIVGLVILTNKSFANDGDSLEIIEEYLHDSFFKNTSCILLKFKSDENSRKYWIDIILSCTKNSYNGIESDAEEFLNLLIFASKRPSIDHQRRILINEFSNILLWNDPEIAYATYESEIYEKISSSKGEERTSITTNYMNDLIENIKLNSELSSQESV